MLFKQQSLQKCSHHSLPLKLASGNSNSIRKLLFMAVGPVLTLLSPPIFQLSPTDKTMDFQKHFRIRHYAGDVTWVTSHIHTLSHLFWYKPVHARKSDRMLCRVEECKPYNPIKGGRFMTLVAAGVFIETFLQHYWYLSSNCVLTR